MIMLMVGGSLFGAAFSTRFKVFALVLVICVAWLVIIADGVVRGLGFWRVVLAIVVVSTFVQTGYLLGSLARAVMISAHAAKDNEVSARTSA
jgi:hypothetical protein